MLPHLSPSQSQEGSDKHLVCYLRYSFCISNHIHWFQTSFMSTLCTLAGKSWCLGVLSQGFTGVYLLSCHQRLSDLGSYHPLSINGQQTLTGESVGLGQQKSVLSHGAPRPSQYLFWGIMRHSFLHGPWIFFFLHPLTALTLSANCQIWLLV